MSLKTLAEVKILCPLLNEITNLNTKEYEIIYSIEI